VIKYIALGVMPHLKNRLFHRHMPGNVAYTFLTRAGAGLQVYYSIIYRALMRQFADVELKTF
jgi:hypothetical protein